MKLVYDGSSIECNSAEIISRNIYPSAYMEIKSIGKCMTFKCKQNSEAKILSELNPKSPIHNANSNLNLNDKLECQDLYLATNNRRQPKIKVINYSHTHKAQIFYTDKYTYAEISRQIPNIPELIPKLTFTPVIMIE
jgi:hypothetical protein